MRILLLGLLGYFLIGCQGAKRSDAYSAYKAEYQEYANEEAYFVEEDMMASNRGYPQQNAPAQQSSLAKYNKNTTKKKENDQQEQTAARMVHYNGYANLHVARPEEIIEEIVAVSRTYKGDIERRSTRSITIRVPKDSFSQAFTDIIALGEVLNKSVTSEDVTEAFTSVELRLKTAQTTRDRLLALLEKAKDEEEKIKILRQLQRLNEQIDVIEAQMRTLQSLADYSSISVDLTARKAVADDAQQVEASGFSWIHNLSPFQSTVCHSGKRLALSTPEGFVSLHPKGAYISESADGTVLRSTRLDNNPRGSSSFWQQAIQDRLASGFGTVESASIGEFQSLSLYEDSDNPYVWIIAVRDAGKYLELIEVYFPNREQLDRHQAAVLQSITGGAK